MFDAYTSLKHAGDVKTETYEMTEGLEVDWEAKAKFHEARLRQRVMKPTIRRYHIEQLDAAIAHLQTQTSPVWDWKKTIEAHQDQMKKKPFDSQCIVCKQPCYAPKGNWNINLVTLCKKAKCRRQRKTELQREARRQREFEQVVKHTTKKPTPPKVERKHEAVSSE
jgi:hypothetical protein